jgi:GH24 family phage-related lysozyme (muramidase)
MTTMRTSAAGRKAVAQREGNELTAYLDSVGILTIGVGHTTAAGPPKVRKGMKITASTRAIPDALPEVSVADASGSDAR